MGRRLLTWGGLALLLVVAVASAGWDGTTAPEPPAPRRSTGETQATYAAAAVVAQRAALGLRDLPAGFVEVTPRNRGERDAQDFLDLCGAPVPSPRHRLATHGRVFAAPRRGVRTEVVVYRPGGAERALARMRAAPRSCARPVPPRPVQQPSALALRLRLTFPVTPAGPAGRHELVVLRSGDALSLVEVDGTSAGLTLGLARRLGPRLQAATSGGQMTPGQSSARGKVAPQLPPPGPPTALPRED